MYKYPATYIDSNGTEETFIINDGEYLSLNLRNVNFEGESFDGLMPTEDSDADLLKTFTLDKYNDLCAFRLKCKIEIPIHDNGSISTGNLIMNLTLGSPCPKGLLDKEELLLTLVYGDMQVPGSGSSAAFENELNEIQAKLPEGIYLKACINCLYSDYSPFGRGLFGDMMCFQSLKHEYLKVKSKQDFWRVHDKPDRQIQETYLCPHFQRRVPGTGYRG